MKNDLTKGSISKSLIIFALPYLLSCFLQTFYGMADLLIVGIYDGASTTSAVSIGSQVMHMLTVIIVGFAMGSTIHIGKNVGAKDDKQVSKTIGTTIVLFTLFAFVLSVILLIFTKSIAHIMMTPSEAMDETITYLFICFIGIPFIVAYNIIGSIFRGLGDSKSPMYFVGVACIVNIVMDFLFIGYFDMGAMGAALGTVFGQFVSSLLAFIVIINGKLKLDVSRKDIRLDKAIVKDILSVGTPIAMQDGLIQVGFIVITVIANSRGLVASSAVGIVEKIISFMFLVPSAFLSSISTFTAQNVGAKLPERARKGLFIGLSIAVSFGIICMLYSQIAPATLVGLFTKDSRVVVSGCQYLRSYSFDCIFAGVHFCFSGYFCGHQKPLLSFIHNVLSMVFIRVPVAYLTSIFFKDTLFPMGMAAPLGSLFSAILCIIFYIYYFKRNNKAISA